MAKLLTYIIIWSLPFAGLSLAASWVSSITDCSTLTEENYYDSLFYKENQLPLEEGIKACNNAKDSVAGAGLLLLPIGPLVGFSHWSLTRLKQSKQSRQNSEDV